MNADQVIEGIGKVVFAANPAEEYCLFWSDYWWWMCMTKAEWSGWMQAVGVIVTLCLMWASMLNEKYKHTAERQERIRSDSVIIKYFLAKNPDFTNGLDAFIIQYDLVYSVIKKTSEYEFSGERVSDAIDCLRCTEDDFKKIFNSLGELNFQDRGDLHLNIHAGAIDNIISACNSLAYIYSRYSLKKEVLKNMSEDILEFSRDDYIIYWQALENSHREFGVYVDHSFQYFEKIKKNWSSVMDAIRRA